jgi:transposase
MAVGIQLPPQQKRKPQFDPNQNHGRYAASDYSGCPSVSILHDSLKSGDACPVCVEASLYGRLYALKPEVIVLLQGNPIITGTCYECEKLRCTLCGNQYVAEMPDAIADREKYDETCRSAIAIARYYSGQPFKRTEVLQALQGVPLADATQWDQMMKLYAIVMPVYLALEEMAANGQLISYDDTGNRILAVHGDKKSVHTTAFISIVDNYIIYLFYTSQRYAGQNMESLVAKRTTEDSLITMTDASSQNMPKKINEKLLARWIICFCLVHGRRKFYEVLNCFNEECEFVLNIIGKIYKNEAHCKKNNLSPQQRLEYHQEHSSGPMNALRVWLNNQLLFHLTEDNSGLGEATRYMLRHWEALTKFLSVVGAPIDNSLCEQAIKIAIRHRRNSLFYKTFKGAQVGDCLMSIIHTAAKNKVNIFDYLNILQRHSQSVRASPGSWLPWNYQDTLKKMLEQDELIAA